MQLLKITEIGDSVRKDQKTLDSRFRGNDKRSSRFRGNDKPSSLSPE
jgi:hypothetical protein